MPVFLVGFIDGIIMSMAFYIFFYRLQFQAPALLLNTAIAGIIIALLLAIGAYFTRRNETSPATDNKILTIYQKLDIDEAIKDEMTSDTIAEQKIWKKEWAESDNTTRRLRPVLYGLTIFLSYWTGTLIIVFNSFLHQALNIEWFLLPLILLGIAGFFKYKWRGGNPYYGTAIIVLTGITVAIGMYFISGLF